MASNAKALSFLSGDLSLSGTEVSINVAGSVQSDSITGSTITMKNTGSTIVASDGTTAVLSESGGTVTLTADTAVIEGSSSGDLVRITQTGSGNALVVEDSANPDSTPFVVSSDGKVFIGSNTSLTSFFGSFSSKIAVSGEASPLIIESFGNDAFGSRIDLLKTRGTTSNSKTIINNNDTLGEIYFGGTDGTSAIPAARISAGVDGTPGTNDMPGRLVFSTTADNESITTERMRIDSNGNVGIGTSSLNFASGSGAVIYGATDTRLKLTNVASGTGSYQGFEMSINNTTGAGQFTQWQQNQPILFLTNNGSNVSERMRIDSSGNVGIGTSSPNAKLTVQTGSNSNDRFYVGEGSATISNSITTGSNISSGELNFYTQDNTNGQNAVGAAIGSYTSGSWLFDSHPQDLRFYTTASSSTTLTERMRIDSSGRLLVTPSVVVSGYGIRTTGFRYYNRYALELEDVDQYTQYAGFLVKFKRNGTDVGTIQTTGSSTAYNTSSDYRLKENITEITDGISRVKQLNPSRFNFISDPDRTVDGFIAHEVQDIVPESVSGEKDAVDSDGNPEYQGLDYAKLTPLLTAALKEAIAKIEMLEERIAVLEAK